MPSISRRPADSCGSLCQRFINTRCQLTLIVVLLLAAVTQAQQFTTLYSFTGGSDGGNPNAGVVQDRAGNLYGTTIWGGNLICNYPAGCGVVYKLDAVGTETVLYTFCSQGNCIDGWGPNAVTRDESGKLYGTTSLGGHSGCESGCGTVFKIGAARNETVPYSFWGGSDGCYPDQGLIRDYVGNSYGTTYSCGSSGDGTIFKVDSARNASNFTLLHVFTGSSSDGAGPQYGHLTMDGSDNLYGVTAYGGSGGCYDGYNYGCGVLYELSKNGTFRVLHSFAGGATDGCYPYGTVLQDETGNFYGTTYGCGFNKLGTIWKVSKEGKETILHDFAGGSRDGCNPVAGVTRDSKGNLYGVTWFCGANGLPGTLYELSAKGKLTLLHSFGGRDGRIPIGEVLRTAKGTLFGTTAEGGTGNCAYGCGTVWSYVP